MLQLTTLLFNLALLFVLPLMMLPSDLFLKLILDLKLSLDLKLTALEVWLLALLADVAATLELELLDGPGTRCMSALGNRDGHKEADRPIECHHSR